MQKQEQKQLKKASLKQMFQFCTSFEKFLIIISVISTFAVGAVFPIFSIIFSNSTFEFRSPSDLVKRQLKNLYYFLIIGGGAFFVGLIGFGIGSYIAENLAITYREKYYQALLNQDISWFDQINPNELATKISNHIQNVQNGLSKIGNIITSISMFIFGFALGYIKGWQLALVITGSMPFLFFAMVNLIKLIMQNVKKQQIIYQKAGSYAEQAITEIKTVKALQGEDFEFKNYLVELIASKKSMIWFGIMNGFGLGIVFLIQFCDYGLGFWFGSWLIDKQINNPAFGRPYNFSDVLAVFFCVLIGCQSLGSTQPLIQNLGQALSSVHEILETINKKPLIIQDDKDQIQMHNFKGEITFKNVKFAFPTNKENNVLKDISFNVYPNQKVAIVGESGCGKSTIMQLIERFYDADEGQILFDNENIKNFNLQLLRRNIGYVGQEPVLFAQTIKQNLKYGNDYASEEEMIEALKSANAWDFIKDLPDKLDTFVGIGGSQFSGGQKQRICIARAILKQPKILLLDEATSALDRLNEKLIQETLNNLSKGRTTITIAHRLTTIQDSDQIFIISDGQIAQIGTYQELIQQKDGKFYALVMGQLHAEQKIESNEIFEQQEIKKEIDILNEQQNLEEIQPQKQQNYNKDSYLEPLLDKDDQNLNLIQMGNKIEQQKLDKKQESKKKKEISKRLLELNKPERLQFFIGLLSSLAQGAILPVFAIFFSKMIKIMSQYIPNEQNTDYRSQSRLYCLIFVVIAFAALFIYTLTKYMFSYVGYGLTTRLRQILYKKILNMPMEWFDNKKNSPGALSANLAADAELVNNLTTTLYTMIIQAAGAFIVGLLIAFLANWRMALIGVGLSPLVIISSVLHSKVVKNFAAKTDDKYKESTAQAVDTLVNIRTVHSCGNIQLFQQNYEKLLENPKQQISKQAFFNGFFSGFSQFTIMIMYGLNFYLGSLIAINYMLHSFSQYRFMLAIFAIVFAAFSAGQTQMFAPDIGKAYLAAENLLNLEKLKDENQIQDEYFQKNSTVQITIPKKQLNVNGRIEFINVSFKYPTRGQQIYNNLSFTIEPGQKAAIVGESGCGKSTIVNILLRYYEIASGSIMIDGKNINDYDIHQIRNLFGVVQQEPILFNQTILYNIKYNTNSDMESIQSAATDANALNFINSNEFEETKSNGEGKQKVKCQNSEQINNTNQGFNKIVGTKGIQLSGGQKQRIAIARAIIKQPKILLLDEATSALDNVNEKIVQESITKIMQGKTSITIAHRISTIKSSDIIFMFNKGQIVERGTYEELIHQKGVFYNFEKGLQQQQI